ncbi:MAG TPA: hypothetical protein VFG21_00845 [Xanthomonadaceae bacterium]|nr:hypothetical protein [Xanthomonadaceae bacterium]
MSEKVDKGFELNYWNLSYRRKLVRTLWMAVIFLLFFLFPADMRFMGMSRNVMIVLLYLLLVPQAVYNYRKWQREKRDPGPERPTP